MKTVYKYTVDFYGNGILMPIGAEVLSVAFQQDNLCLWAKVDPEAPKEPRRFRVFGTGHRIPAGESLKFIGTAFTGPYVFHVFEVI